MPPTATAQADEKLERLQRYLERDPANLSLLGDAARAAYETGDFERAAELLARHRALAALPPDLANLEGMTALAIQRYADAAAIFEGLRAHGDDPALRFNLAWAKAMLGAHQDALHLLDDETLGASPRAPALKIRMMHHLGLLDDALACGELLARRYPKDIQLMGALASAALDAGKPEAATAYGKRAGDDPTGRTALAMLALADHDSGRALDMFDSALAAQPANARAWIGKGLSLMAAGDTAHAAVALDRGAELFEDHLGSWVAAGWAHFVNGDMESARARFERALAVDPTFAEIHGGLAVLDILAGDLASAKKRCETAQRLDRNCLGAALAQSIMLDRGGHGKLAQRVRDIAMSRPIGLNGETIAQALVAFASGTRR